MRALVPSERAYLPRVPAPSESVDLVAASFKQMPVTQVRPGTHARLVEQASEGRSKTSPELLSVDASSSEEKACYAVSIMPLSARLTSLAL